MVTSDDGSASDEWAAAPTVNDSKHDTAPHDLRGLARASTGDPALVFSEGIEECVRAMYVYFRKRGLTRAEMDNIVLGVRGEIRKL